MPVTLETSSRPRQGAWLEIRKDHLLSNLNTLKSFSPDCGVMAVVKANAYGHGLLEVARALEGKVASLGVSSIREVLELKEHKIETPVFLFGRFLSHELPAALIDGVTLSVSSLDEAREISELSESMGRKTPVHVKIDTGMGRLGIPFGAAISQIKMMSVLSGIRLEGIYTHFPTAERGDGFAEKQVSDFVLLIQALEKEVVTFRWRHAANSAGSMRISNPIFNMIRPGLMLYGIYPDASLRARARVLPILSLKSRLIFLKRIQPGETVGYGRDYVAKDPTTIGLLPIGYSHGYPFPLSNRASVLFQGKRYPLAGRVSMDYLAIDLKNAPARIGDELTLLGEDGSESIGAEELAALAGTNAYEIVTRLQSYLPRYYR